MEFKNCMLAYCAIVTMLTSVVLHTNMVFLRVAHLIAGIGLGFLGVVAIRNTFVAPDSFALIIARGNSLSVVVIKFLNLLNVVCAVSYAFSS